MVRRAVRLASLLLAIGACGYFVGMKAARLPVVPDLLGGLVALLLPLCVLELAWTARDLRTGAARRLLTGGKLLALAGATLALAGGLANWLLGVQGVVVLAEGEAVRLDERRQLVDLDLGPLARTTELDVTIRLQEVRLVPSPSGVDREVTVLARSAQGAETLAIAGLGAARHGAMVLRAGAFGFAPRIVILKEGRQLFDRVVPFLTERSGAGSVVFEGSFVVEREKLGVTGSVGLESLDERMRGHPLLHLSVEHDGRKLGAGTLELGHFAELPGGYRIGFAGLPKWSEILVTRRSYPGPIVAGLSALAAGTLLWIAGRPWTVR